MQPTGQPFPPLTAAQIEALKVFDSLTVSNEPYRKTIQVERHSGKSKRW